MSALKRLSLATLAASVLLAPAARATLGGGIEFSIGQRTKHGGFALTLNHGSFERCRPVGSYAPQRVWVPGHYETRCERVWVEGRTERVLVPAVYGWRHDAYGRAFQVQLQAARWKTICHAGHYENREVRVWVEGHWR